MALKEKVGQNKKTPLFKVHEQLGARMTLFAGWQMPLYYTGIIPEHMAVRQKAGVFDISHMGKIEIRGGDALKLLEFLLPARISRLESGQVSYTFLCNQNGGLIDDLTVFVFSTEHYLLCVNAVCAEKDYSWIKSHAGPDVTVKNVTSDLALLALQGPLSEIVLDRAISGSWEKPRRFHFSETGITLTSKNIIVSRLGYTGEDGFELFCTPEEVISLWDKIINAGRDLGLRPCALGARDTLRLEMAYVLYGEDIDETVTLLEARFGRFVDFEKDRFIGKEALLEEKEKGSTRKLVGFVMEEKGIPRKGYPVFYEQKRVGTITSGSFSPVLHQGIGLGLINAYLARSAQEVEIGIREKRVKAKVALTPFIKPKTG